MWGTWWHGQEHPRNLWQNTEFNVVREESKKKSEKSLSRDLSLDTFARADCELFLSFFFSLLVEKFSKVFFKLSSLAMRWLKLKRELGTGSQAELGLL